ncbi:MAG: short-chain fatty acyl-CoA regulator family protein [Magnetospiraceae bacterium]
MESEILGARIRQRRRESGITQVELARRVGISASYLNLIEWNKRQIGGSLLRSVAEALNLSLNELNNSSERRLLNTLREIANLPALAPLGAEQKTVSDFVGRFPGWARGIVALARSEREAREQARFLSDRLSNDPFLGETIHSMLTRIAAIRSASEILVHFEDMPQQRRERFDQMIHEEIQVLSEIGEALTSYLDTTEETNRILTPVDEVEAFFENRENRFEELEEAADALVVQLRDGKPAARRQDARRMAEAHLDDLILDLIADQAEIKTAVARERARQALLNYATQAILMPLADFTATAKSVRFDVEALAEMYGATFDTVCHRLTALPPENGIPRFGYFSANAAGTIIEAHNLPNMVIPRYAAACPLWILFRCQQTPETILRQRALFPNGGRFVFLARAQNQGPVGFGKPRHYVTHMLTMTEENAAHTIYSPDISTPVENVGAGCRLCPRADCSHRVDNPMAH